MRFVNKSIHRKLLLLLLVVGFVPAAAAVLHIYWGAVVGVDEVLGDFLRDRVHVPSLSIDANLSRRMEAADALRRIAEADGLQAVTTAPLASLFDEVVAVDLQGRPLDLDQTGAGETRAPLAIPGTMQSPDAPDAVFLHEIAAPADAQRPNSGSRLLFLAPLRQTAGTPGRHRGLLACIVASQRIVEGSDALGLSIYSNRGVFVWGERINAQALEAVSSRDGSTVERLEGWTPSGQGYDRLLVGYASPQTLRRWRDAGRTTVSWTLLTTIRAEEATGLLSFLFWRSALFGLGLLAPAIFLLSYVATRRFVRPVRELHKHIERLAEGDLKSTVTVDTRDELEDLAVAFNDLSRSLAYSQAELEGQVLQVRAKATHLELVQGIVSAMISAFSLPRLVELTHIRLSTLVPSDALTVVLFHDPMWPAEDEEGEEFSSEGPGASAPRRSAATSSLHSAGGGVFFAVDGTRVRSFCQMRLEEVATQEAARSFALAVAAATPPPAPSTQFSASETPTAMPQVSLPDNTRLGAVRAAESPDSPSREPAWNGPDRRSAVRIVAWEGSPPPDSPLDPRFSQVVLLPLRVDSGLLGVLALGRHQTAVFSAEEVATLVQVTQVLALAVEHITLYERTRDFARVLEHKVEERARLLERAQDQLVQAERFAATGRLAASIAHEINNPLGIVKNYLRIIRDRIQGPQDGDDATAQSIPLVQAGGSAPMDGISLHPGSVAPPPADREVADALQVANEELDRIARIVRSLLNFYRPSDLRRVALNLNDEIHALLPLMEVSFRRKAIRVEIELADLLPRPQLSPDHVRQVLLNLLKNAEDAVNQGGVIRIATWYEANGAVPPGTGSETADSLTPSPDASAAQLRSVGGGKCVVLEVSDNGCGITQADRPHIFEPFFTRKREGQGTGLGLAVTYGIIRNLRGSIEVTSAPGEGTTFTVRIPAGP